MFSKFLSLLLPGLADADPSSPSAYGVAATTLLMLIWVSWYTWRFTFRPALYPREPKQMPYWIPGKFSEAPSPIYANSYFRSRYIFTIDVPDREQLLIAPGHAIQFFKDSEGTFTKSREYFENSREPFGVTVAGQTLYVITSPDYVPLIYRNTTTLTFDEFVRDMMLSVGASDDGVRKMWESPRPDSVNPDRLHKILAHAGEDYYRQQFHPGNHLGDLWLEIQQCINKNLNWDNVSHDCIVRGNQNQKTLSLLRWCQDVLLSSVTDAVFGPKLLQIEPDLLRAFITFDDNSWKLTYKLPRLAAEEVYAGKDKIIATFAKYFALPTSERKGQSWVVRVLETEMRKIEVEERDIAALFVMPFWVINSNAYKLCFWIMAYLVHHPPLFQAIRDELLPKFANGFAGFEHRIEDCPRMIALYNEMLRYTTASASIRSVAEPTDLGNVTLSAGAKVLIPYRQLHFDPAIFGGNAATFDAERFLHNKELSKHGAFRPFGGGTTYCAGRYVARREVLAFVAMAVREFDIDLAGDEQGASHQTLPVCDVKKPSLGVLPPMLGQDVQVVVAKRANTK